MRAVERVTGERPPTCPWWAFQDPLVGETMRAHRLYRRNALASAYGHDVPAVLISAIDVYDTALTRIEAFDMEEIRKKHEAARKKPKPGRKP